MSPRVPKFFLLGLLALGCHERPRAGFPGCVYLDKQGDHWGLYVYEANGYDRDIGRYWDYEQALNFIDRRGFKACRQVAP